MKPSSLRVVIWVSGFLMPLWLFLADLMTQRFAHVSLQGVWLYGGIIAGAIICALVISLSHIAIWQRIALVFASWLLLAGEVLTLGALQLARNGLAGTQ